MTLSELTCDAAVEVIGGHLMNSHGSVWDIVENIMNLIILHTAHCVGEREREKLVKKWTAVNAADADKTSHIF